MTVFHYLGIGVVAVLLMLLAFLRKSGKSNDNQDVVPISDLTEIQELRKMHSSSDSNILSQKSFTDHVIEENLHQTDSKKTEQTSISHEHHNKIMQKDLELAQHKLAEKDKKMIQLQEVNERLLKAMEREVALNAAIPPSSKINERDYKDVLSKNEELKKDNENMKQAVRKLENELEVAKLMQEIVPSQEEFQKIKELEKEISLLKSENTRLNEQRNTIGSREMENMTLKKNNEENLQKIKELSAEFEYLKSDSAKRQSELVGQLENEKSEKQQLLDDVRKAQELLSSSKEEVSSLKRESESQQKDLKRMIKELEDELNHIKNSKNIFENDRLLGTAQTDLKEIVEQKENLSREKGELLASLEKLQQYNAHLTEKEKLLQYELTKARAKALGLEEICQDYKIKIEQLVTQFN